MSPEIKFQVGDIVVIGVTDSFFAIKGKVLAILVPGIKVDIPYHVIIDVEGDNTFINEDSSLTADLVAVNPKYLTLIKREDESKQTLEQICQKYLKEENANS